jgi:hypothetical protein
MKSSSNWTAPGMARTSGFRIKTYELEVTWKGLIHCRRKPTIDAVSDEVNRA